MNCRYCDEPAGPNGLCLKHHLSASICPHCDREVPEGVPHGGDETVQRLERMFRVEP